MMREGVHPETPKVPFTPGWDLVGVVDRLGDGTSGIEIGQIVAALPIAVRILSSSVYRNKNLFRYHPGGCPRSCQPRAELRHSPSDAPSFR